MQIGRLFALDCRMTSFGHFSVTLANGADPHSYPHSKLNWETCKDPGKPGRKATIWWPPISTSARALVHMQIHSGFHLDSVGMWLQSGTQSVGLVVHSTYTTSLPSIHTWMADRWIVASLMFFLLTFRFFKKSQLNREHSRNVRKA